MLAAQSDLPLMVVAGVAGGLEGVADEAPKSLGVSVFKSGGIGRGTEAERILRLSTQLGR